MFKKVLEYTGEYRRITYASVLFMLLGIVMNVLPFFFVYQLITPLMGYGEIHAGGILWRIIVIAACALLYAIFYIKGLSLSHDSAYHTLEQLRISLQGKLEKQPLGVIQEKGVGVIKKIFIDDIESIELLLAHPCRKALQISQCPW